MTDAYITHTKHSPLSPDAVSNKTTIKPEENTEEKDHNSSIKTRKQKAKRAAVQRITGARITTHYENMPIQIYWKFNHRKIENFQTKNSYSFHISAQNIDCGYSQRRF